MRCLVTGASGFIGSYLVEFLLQKGHSVCASGQTFGPRSPSLIGDVVISKGNIQDSDYLDTLLMKHVPEVIFHLAAQSSPGISLHESELTFKVNAIGTGNLLDAILRAKLNPKIMLASSSAVYASTTSSECINEDHPTDPSSPYGSSKLLSEKIAKSYIKKNELNIAIARPFFLIGPRKVEDVCSTFARSIVAIERGHRSHIEIGNLSIERDFLDVRDGIEALYLVATEGVTGECYNICSGEGYSLRYVLDVLKEYSEHTINEKSDPSKIRKIDELVRIGDPTRTKKLGWSPLRAIESTLAEMLLYWREDTFYKI
jgi:GDP-4-dehydro-6-deoxy-D-mannose reductase